jgi:CHAD domain-containing protein
MIKKKSLQVYLEKRFSQIENHLTTFSVTNNQEELHQFRVSVKKLKAMITLLERTIPSKKIIGHFGPLKRIFKHAGEIRATYVELLLMKQYALKGKNYYMEQEKTIALKSKEFGKKKAQHLATLKRVKKRILSDVKGIHNKNIQHYIKKQLNDLDNYFSSEDDVNQYHKARMVLKNLFFNYSLFPEKLKVKLNLNQNYLNKLQDTIGKWHDTEIVMSHVAPNITSKNLKLDILKKRERTLFQNTKNLAKHFRASVFSPKNESGNLTKKSKM